MRMNRNSWGCSSPGTWNTLRRLPAKTFRADSGEASGTVVALRWKMAFLHRVAFP